MCIKFNSSIYFAFSFVFQYSSLVNFILNSFILKGLFFHYFCHNMVMSLKFGYIIRSYLILLCPIWYFWTSELQKYDEETCTYIPATLIYIVLVISWFLIYFMDGQTDRWTDWQTHSQKIQNRSLIRKIRERQNYNLK